MKSVKRDDFLGVEPDVRIEQKKCTTRVTHKQNKKQCSRQLQCGVPCSVCFISRPKETSHCLHVCGLILGCPKFFSQLEAEIQSIAGVVARE